MRRTLLAVLLIVTACSPPNAPVVPVLKSGTASNYKTLGHSAIHLDLGRKVYNARCYYCHGYSGDARTLAATYLTPPPRDFTALAPTQLQRQAMAETVRSGSAGTSMQGFARVLSEAEIFAVVDFVRDEFMRRKAQNTRYHTAENGWPNHERYQAAFAFVRGELAADTPLETLSPELRFGRDVFLSSCVSCHERAPSTAPGAIWEARPVSFPRNGYTPGSRSPIDAMTSASPYLLHDKAPQIGALTAQEQCGESLYQENCAFCHAADGTGKNWIGRFLEPHPRDLTDPDAMRGMTAARLARTIAEGIPGTAMPAWESVLDAQDIQAIVSYVSQAFYHPSEAP